MLLQAIGWYDYVALLLSVIILAGLVVYIIGNTIWKEPQIKVYGLILMMLPALILAILGGINISDQAISFFANVVIQIYMIASLIIGFIDMVYGMMENRPVKGLEGAFVMLTAFAIFWILYTFAPMLAVDWGLA